MLYDNAQLAGLEVEAGELRVVVEHLLEVRHAPPGVGRVAVEAAAELVMDAARGHALERRRRHGERVRVARAAVIAEEERRHRRPGGPGRGPEAAPGGVEARRERGDGRADRRRP